MDSSDVDHKKYRYLMSRLVDELAEYEERSTIFEETDIPRNHYHNVTNPDRTNPGRKEHPYYIPAEWIIKLTRYASSTRPSKYALISEMAKDCGGRFIPPELEEELMEILKESAPDPLKLLALVQKFRGEGK
jgi:hypothetical protein